MANLATFSQQNDECAIVSAYIVLLLRIIIQVLQGPATKYVRVAPFLYEYILYILYVKYVKLIALERLIVRKSKIQKRVDKTSNQFLL